MRDREMVLRAAEAAAGELYGDDGRRVEVKLVAAVERNLEGELKRENRTDEVLGWQRQPGGVDLAILDAGRARTVMEMKLDDLDQSLWDIFKLASLLRHDHVHEAFLIYEAAGSSFEGQMDCAALFRLVEPAPMATVELLRRWPQAWGGLLDGGYGNYPMEAVCDVILSARGRFPLGNDPSHEVRVLEIEAPGSGTVHFDQDGWPGTIPPNERAGHKGLPTVLTSSGAADEKLGATMKWPKKITQAWLTRTVPELSDEEYAALLEVMKGKGWTAQEFEERVFPLRLTPPESRGESPAQEQAEAQAAETATAVAGEVARKAPAVSSAIDLPDLVQRVLPAVVQVVASRKNQTATGSGFAIAPIKGDEDISIFVTNAHLTVRVDDFRIRWGQDSFYRADLLHEDRDNDIALLEVPITPPATLPVRYLRDVRVGESVIAVGSPLGLTETVTSGIVSALNREIPVFSGTRVSNAIQTSAAINAGNSGGPLIGMDGRVLGVNTSGPEGTTGLAFTIPAETALRLVVNLGD